MATFLVTPKMNPALAARVEASVRGRRAEAEPRPALVAIARLVGLGVMALIVAALVFAFERRASEREAARADLLAAIEEQTRDLDEKDHQLLDRAEATLIEEAKVTSDIVADTLHDDAAFSALIAKPAVYVAGERTAFASSTTLWPAARESVKDAFVMCLFDPPAQRDEKALLSKVRTAYAGGIEARSRNVERLGTAAEGLPFLSRAWLKHVEDADSLAALGELRTAFEHAPLARAKAAAKAEILIYLFDDPPEPGARVELDGASRHRVQVGITDLATSRPLLRMTSTLDPAWLSEDSRFQHGRALNACLLALDVRQHIGS